jgi:hypothetical protein
MEGAPNEPSIACALARCTINAGESSTVHLDTGVGPATAIDWHAPRRVARGGSAEAGAGALDARERGLHFIVSFY